MASQRTVFLISDGTGITVESMAHSLLSQFEGIRYHQKRQPFVDTAAKASLIRDEINETAKKDGIRPLVFSTLLDAEVAKIVHSANAFSQDFFDTFLAPLENELGTRSTHTVGRSHGTEGSDYKKRIEAINYTLLHDDGITENNLDTADIILIGVSRCGKTPASLYLAMQFGLRVANFPLIPEDFERGHLPGAIHHFKSKLFGLTIQPERLAKIREERLAKSTYASLKNCLYETREAERMMTRENIQWLDSSSKSIEEISTSIMQLLRAR